jgi:hypothetical protein
MSEVEASEVPDTAVAQAPADEVPCADLPLSARVEAVLYWLRCELQAHAAYCRRACC